MSEENEPKPDETPEQEQTPVEPPAEPIVPIPQKPKPGMIDYQTENLDLEIEKKEK